MHSREIKDDINKLQLTVDGITKDLQLLASHQSIVYLDHPLVLHTLVPLAERKRMAVGDMTTVWIIERLIVELNQEMEFLKRSQPNARN